MLSDNPNKDEKNHTTNNSSKRKESKLNFQIFWIITKINNNYSKTKSIEFIIRELSFLLFLHCAIKSYKKQQIMQSKFRLVALPRKFHEKFMEKELLKCDHFAIVPANVYQEFIKSKDENWLNLIFLNDNDNLTNGNGVGGGQKQADIVTSILKKPNSSVLVPVKAARSASSGIQHEPFCIFISENCLQNFITKFKLNENKPIEVKIEPFEASSSTTNRKSSNNAQHQIPQLATKASIFIINQPHEITNEFIDDILDCYFRIPRLVYRNYTYEIPLDNETLGRHIYAKHFNLISCLEKLYFRCVHLETKDNPFELNAIIVKTLTNLQQSTSVNMALPKRKLHEMCPATLACPIGLEKYAHTLRSSILPFLPQQSPTTDGSSTNLTKSENNTTVSLSAFPLFLLHGHRGSGKTTILKSVAKSLGVHLLGVDCVDIVSQIPSQTEAKLKIAINKANICEPLIICLHNFEMFGIDSEGREDVRILTTFQVELQAMFAKQRQYPVIVVGISNEKEIRPLIRRLFLELITIETLSKDERYETLRWLHRIDSITQSVYSGNIDTIPLCEEISYLTDFNDIDETLRIVADKTSGYLYGDLKLLYENSKHEMLLANTSDGCTSDDDELELKYFELNLAKMQASFSDGLGAPKVPKVLWSDIGGLAKLKDEIQSSIGMPLKHMHLMGKNLRRSGILLYGPPGTGKTLVAKAVATECNLNFLSVQGPELLNMYVGQSEQNVREVFVRARSAAPCVLFLDELDSLAPNRGVAGDSGGVMDRVVSQLMTEMNGMTDSDPQKQIFILAATNRPDLIDPSLLRPGRFDKLLYVGPCTTSDEKLAVLNALMKRFTLNKELSKQSIADLLKEDMTGADLYSICSNAWLNAVRRTISTYIEGKIDLADLIPEKVIVNLNDFKVASTNFVPSVSKKDMEYFNKLKVSFS